MVPRKLKKVIAEKEDSIEEIVEETKPYFTPIADADLPKEEQPIEVPILNDGLTEATETFRVVLTNATENGISETFGVATVSIRDNDPGLRFESSIYSFAEAVGEPLVNVLRGTDAPGTITVDYATEPDTATPQLDYIPVTGTLVFGPEDRIKTIHISILQDALNEPTETFRLILSNPSAGVSLGNPNTATVRILDNDQGFGFPAATFTVSEDQGEIALPVSRGSDMRGEISVDYSVEPFAYSAVLRWVEG